MIRIFDFMNARIKTHICIRWDTFAAYTNAVNNSRELSALIYAPSLACSALVQPILNTPTFDRVILSLPVIIDDDDAPTWRTDRVLHSETTR
jgi:hypothetical protein